MEERGNAARCRRWTRKRRENGWVRVTVEVPAGRISELQAIAANMRSAQPYPAAVPPAAPAEPLKIATAATPWVAAEQCDWWEAPDEQ